MRIFNYVFLNLIESVFAGTTCVSHIMHIPSATCFSISLGFPCPEIRADPMTCCCWTLHAIPSETGCDVYAYAS